MNYKSATTKQLRALHRRELGQLTATYVVALISNGFHKRHGELVE
jgi:hypothetical protein